MYLQDKWYVNDDLTIIYGVRYDQRETPTAARLNPNFLARNGVPNNAKFDFDLVQPRFSFNMNVTDEVSGMFENSFSFEIYLQRTYFYRALGMFFNGPGPRV